MMVASCCCSETKALVEDVLQYEAGCVKALLPGYSAQQALHQVHMIAPEVRGLENCFHLASVVDIA